jgi:hypothetical protein
MTIKDLKKMTDDDNNCKQCKLSVGLTTKVSWLPSKFAIKGKVILIDDAVTGDQDTWTVDEVYGPELPYSYVNERSQDYKRTRRASDI